MRKHRLLALLAFAVLSQACNPDESGLLPLKTTSGNPTPTPSPMTGGVGNGNATPTPAPTASPTPTPKPVLQSLAVYPATFTLSSDPNANFDQRGILLSLVGTWSDSQQAATTANWTSAPAGRVNVNSAGYVNVVPNAPAGTVTLTAASGSLTAQAVATITARVLTVSYVELMPTSLALFKPAYNGTNLPEFPTKAQLFPTVVMSDLSTTSAVTWSVSNPSVATVSLAGLVSSLGSGSCTISAKAASDPLKKATCELTVSAKGAVSVTLE